MTVPVRSFPTLAEAHAHLDAMFRSTLAGANAAPGGGGDFQRAASMSVAYCDAAEVVRSLQARTPAEALADLITTHGGHMLPDQVRRLEEVLRGLAVPPPAPIGSAALTFPVPLAEAALKEQRIALLGPGDDGVMVATYMGYQFEAVLSPRPDGSGGHRTRSLVIVHLKTGKTVYHFDGERESKSPDDSHIRRFVQWLYAGLGEPVVPVPSYHPGGDNA